ncbi:MAG: hypothetical protein JXR70_17820 [Spirochaetales bacterium]|nr:hypothetical protein [Spirochaetales bacterium]
MLKALGIGAMVYHFFKNGTAKRFPLDNFQTGCMYIVNARAFTLASNKYEVFMTSTKTFEATAKWRAWSQIFDLLLGGVNPHRDSLCPCNLKARPAGME